MPTAPRPIARIAACAAAFAALATLVPRTAAAQFGSAPASSDKAGPVVPLIGALYGAPERFAGELGAVFTTAAKGDAWAGYAVIADAGQGGARVSVATVTHGQSGLGAQIRLSAIRTWRNSIVVAPNQTFAGPELRVSFTALTVGGGYYWRTAGITPGDRKFAAVTIGIEF